MTDLPDQGPDAGSAPAPTPAAPPPAPGQASWGQAAPSPAPAPAPAPGTWGQLATASAPGAWGQPAAPAPAQPPVAGGWGGPPPGGTGWTPPPGVPAPRPRGPKGTSGRTALLVLGLIIGVVFGANIVNAALPLPEDPTLVDPGPGLPTQPEPTGAPQPVPTEEPVVQPGESTSPIRTLPPLESQAPVETAPPVQPGPVDPGEGVDVGGGFLVFPPSGWTAVGAEGGAVFQKSGALIIAAGFPWEQSAADLAVVYRDAWFTGGEFTGDEPESGQLGSGLPAAGLNYTGVWNGNQVDGAIITAAVNGSGLVVNIVGPSGTLAGVSDDIDLFLGTIQYTGG